MYPNWTTTEGRIPFPSRDKEDLRHLKNACNSLVIQKYAGLLKNAQTKKKKKKERKKSTEPI